MRLSTLFLSLAPLASAQQYLFPVVTRTVPASVSTEIASQLFALGTSIGASPQYTSALVELQDDCDCEDDPVEYAGELLTATGTPAWFTALPSDLQTFVSSVAAAEASIIQKDSGAGSIKSQPGSLDGLWMYGIAVGAVFVGAMLL